MSQMSRKGPRRRVTGVGTVATRKCVEDKAWCMTGTREEAEAALPDWASGRAADVDPAHFHYEIRKVTP